MSITRSSSKLNLESKFINKIPNRPRIIISDNLNNLLEIVDEKIYGISKIVFVKLLL